MKGWCKSYGLKAGDASPQGKPGRSLTGPSLRNMTKRMQNREGYTIAEWRGIALASKETEQMEDFASSRLKRENVNSRNAREPPQSL